MNKFKGKLSKEDLKRFAKEINKKIVASDFKRGRVENPEKVDEERIREVKKYVKSFFDKAVKKKKEREEKLRAKERSNAVNGTSSTTELPDLNGTPSEVQVSPVGDVEMPDDDDDDNDGSSPFVTQASPSMSVEPTDAADLKRKRDTDGLDSPADSETKRLKEGDTPGSEEGCPPPPPPPPPTGTLPEELEVQGELVVQPKEETQEEKELREQEEALMRENEEAMAMALDGSLKVEEQEVKLHKANIVSEVDNSSHINGFNNSMEGIEEADLNQERKGVLSH